MGIFFLVPALVCAVIIPGFLSGIFGLGILCCISGLGLRAAIVHRHTKIAGERVSGGENVLDLASFCGWLAAISTLFIPGLACVLWPAAILIAFV